MINWTSPDAYIAKDNTAVAVPELPSIFHCRLMLEITSHSQGFHVIVDDLLPDGEEFHILAATGLLAGLELARHGGEWHDDFGNSIHVRNNTVCVMLVRDSLERSIVLSLSRKTAAELQHTLAIAQLNPGHPITHRERLDAKVVDQAEAFSFKL